MQIYILATVGVLITILLGIGALQKATPNITFGNTISEFFRINGMSLLAGILLSYAVIYLSITGDIKVLQFFAIDPAATSGAGLLVGLTNQFLLNRIVGLLGNKMPEIKTEKDKVVTA